MSVHTYLPASLSSWYLEPRIGLGPSLAPPRLYSSRPVANFHLGDEPEELSLVPGGVAAEGLRDPLDPHLPRIF